MGSSCIFLQVLLLSEYDHHYRFVTTFYFSFLSYLPHKEDTSQAGRLDESCMFG